MVRLIDPVEDPSLADKALGDAQASGRSLVDWQVFVLPVTHAGTFTCADVADNQQWKNLIEPSSGKLAFDKIDVPANNDACSLTESGGYSRLENLLYRVEVHGGTNAIGAASAIDGPRYGLNGVQLKFSRRNASVMARIVGREGSRSFRVEPAGLDPNTWFAPGLVAELVSIHDDVTQVPAGARERLFTIVDADDGTVTLQDRSSTDTVAAVGATEDGTWFLRLWEPLPDGKEIATATMSGGKSQVIDLGDGITVQLGGDASARLRRGDWWTCAARADGSIEPVGGIFEQPQGPVLHYAPLAAIRPGNPAPADDCRIIAATLTDRIMVYRGGDGQEAKPDPLDLGKRVPLAQKLRVAVLRGEQPVAGARVTFATEGGGLGRLIDPDGNSAVQTATLVTGADGSAEVAWELDPATAVQHATATLVGPAGAAALVPLRFTANLSRAQDTAFDPKSNPVFGGATDVQAAIEALGKIQQVGCATYVLTPNNWVEVLKSLTPNENAKLCFQRGRFETDQRITLTHLGDLVLCGAGDATRLVCDKDECVLEFAECRSVRIEELAIYAPGGATAGAGGKAVMHRNGALTLRQCQTVDIEGCSFLCGGQAMTERTCVTVRGDEERPMRSVRIRANRLQVGFAQDGILVTDAEICVISDNELAALALKEDARYRAMLAKPWQDAILRKMVPDGPIGAATAVSDVRIVIVGKFQVRFASPFSQAGWERLVEAVPPNAAEQASDDGVRRYFLRLIETVSERPDLLGEYQEELKRIEGAGGTALNMATRGSLLVKGEPTVKRGANWRIRDVTGPIGLPGFDSVVPPEEWLLALRDMPYDERSALLDMGDHLRRIARRMLADAQWRKRFPVFAKWYASWAADMRQWARQAITCGGRTLGDVTVSGNGIAAFGQAVHVGTSFRKAAGKTVSARSVSITANTAQLNTLGDIVKVPAGIFVGNADTVRIAGNQLLRLYERFVQIRHGIRVWGIIGPFLAIEKNRIGVGKCGVRIRSTRLIPKEEIAARMWLVADNFAEGLNPAQVVSAPPFVERRFNRPA